MVAPIREMSSLQCFNDPISNEGGKINSQVQLSSWEIVCLQCPESLFDKVDFREQQVFHGFMRLLLLVSDRLHWVL